jgi:hypothetical protein
LNRARWIAEEAVLLLRREGITAQDIEAAVVILTKMIEEHDPVFALQKIGTTCCPNTTNSGG